MKVGHMVSKRFWDNSNRSITDGEMLEIEPRVNGQPLWSTTGEQRLLPVVFQSQLEAEKMSRLSRKTILVTSDVRSRVHSRH
jgi:hypothetical protein